MQLELVFIRHGMTAGNEERRYIGQSDDQPLAARGRMHTATRPSMRYMPARSPAARRRPAFCILCSYP